MSTYRVGNHQPQNVYRDDAYIGVMFTAEDAALVVEAMNEIERAHGPALPIRLRPAVELTPEQFEEIRAGILQALRKDGPSAVRIQPWGAETGSGVGRVGVSHSEALKTLSGGSA